MKQILEVLILTSKIKFSKFLSPMKQMPMLWKDINNEKKIISLFT